MMLATLKGSNCSNNCSKCSGCGDATTLGFSLWKSIKNVASDVYDTSTNVGDVLLAPIKAGGSVLENVVTGDFSGALHDATRVVSSTIGAPVLLASAWLSNVPYAEEMYPVVKDFSEENSESITLATAVIAAIVLSAGTATPALLPSLGIPAATPTAIAGALSTGAATLKVGSELLRSNSLTDEQHKQLQESLTTVNSEMNTTKQDSGLGWLALAIPAIGFFL